MGIFPYMVPCSLLVALRRMFPQNPALRALVSNCAWADRNSSTPRSCGVREKTLGGVDKLDFCMSAHSEVVRQIPGASVPGITAECYRRVSIHKHLTLQVWKDLKEVGWTKGLRTAKVARAEGQHFD